MRITCFLMLLIGVGCHNTQQQIAVENTKVNFERIDFHRRFFDEKDSVALTSLKETYPYLFPKNTTDKIWYAQRKDSVMTDLYRRSKVVFGDLSELDQALTALFKQLKYHAPKFKAPKTFTMITGLDRDAGVIYADSLLFISLDMHLGSEEACYDLFQPYLRNNFTPDHLIVNVAKEMTNKLFAHQKSGRSFLDQIIDMGKRQYLIDLVLPDVSEQEKMAYTAQQLHWIKTNETNVWRYFINNDLLYSTDEHLKNRFLLPAPFSKFYRTDDNKTPPRVGVWIGWQIVKSFMKNKKASLEELIEYDTDKLFKQSRYKP